ncbi:hypothetical protein ACYPKM_02270 [Pseudomonas aeruginosa]
MTQPNAQFLALIPAESKEFILESIAKHYGTSKECIFEEVTGPEAEHLLDYMVEPERSVTLVLMRRHGMF